MLTAITIDVNIIFRGTFLGLLMKSSIQAKLFLNLHIRQQ